VTDTPEAVFEALRENTERPYGRQRTVRAEELVEAAEQFDDKGVLVTALFELMSAYTYAGEERKSPVVFARIVQMWDTRPEDFSEWEEHQLYWRFKWVTNALLQVPDVPLAAIERWNAEMRDRYTKAGHGLQPVYAMRHLMARHTGDPGDPVTDAAYDLWVTRPRTELSDCEACETRERALHHVAAGDDARALQEWEPVLGGKQTCLEEPHISKANALLPLLRCGRADDARSHHLAGYRFARGNPDMGDALGLHLEFCALSRNEGRGLEILAENRGAFESAGAPLDRLGFLTGVEVLLARLAAAGHGTIAVAGPPGREWTVAELLGHVRGEADALAAAFDARNGTAAVSRRRAARLAQRPLLDEPLALGLRAALAAALPAGGPEAGAAAAPAAAADLPDSFAELVAHARELTAVGRPDADDAWNRIRALTEAEGHVHDAAAGPETVLRAELAERRGFDRFDEEDWPQAREMMLRAAALYEEAGRRDRAAASRARAATALAAGADHDDSAGLAAARAELDAELRLAAELSARADAGDRDQGDPDRYLAVLLCDAMLTSHLLMTELPEPSAEVRDAFEASVDRLLAEARRLESPSRASAALQYRANVAARRGRFADAARDLTTALELIDGADQPWRTPRPLALLAQIKVQTGQAREAVPLIHQALSAAARWPDSSLSLGPFHALLGHACAHVGDTAGAVRHLSEAADRLDREGAEQHAAQVRLELADVLADGGRGADSVAVLESVVLGDTAALDPRLVAQVRLNLARGLAALGEQRAAAEEFLGLADAVAAWEDEQYTHTMVACEAAVALAKAGLPDAAATAYRRAVDAHAVAPMPSQVVAMMREFARLAMAGDDAAGLPAALDHLAQADAVTAGVPEDAEDFVHWYQRGATHYQRGRCHAAAQAYAEALAEMERAVTAYEEGGRDGEEPRTEAVRVAALLEANALDAVPAATARLTAAIARCEAAGFPAAAATLSTVRDGLTDH
jgi:tetratricopeptide (TPR) repeat protein